MYRLWGVKKEFDPFRWIIPGIGAGGILPIFRCTFRSWQINRSIRRYNDRRSPQAT